MEAMGDFIPGLVDRPATGILRGGPRLAQDSVSGMPSALLPLPPVPVLSDLAGTAGPVERAEGMADAGDVAGAVEGALALLRGSGGSAVAETALFGLAEASGFAGRVEELSRVAEFLQLVAAAAVERARSQAAAAKTATAPFGSSAPAGWLTGWNTEATPAPDLTATTTLTSTKTLTGWNGTVGPEAGLGWVDDGCRNATEFLRSRLRISAPEARRRLALAAEVLPSTGFTGQPVAPAREELGAVLAAGEIGSRAGTLISMALDRVRHVAAPAAQERMEHALVRTAVENDQDFLTRIARRWTEALDQDGAEPSEQELRQRQGAFIRRSHRGLQHLEIFATTEQFEYLLTVMNTATNPRTGTGRSAATDESGGPGGGTTGREDSAGPSDGAGRGLGPGADGEATVAEDTAAAAERLDLRTRPQRLLDGLVGGCKLALATGNLPATGGLRPQVMVTIDYRDLFSSLMEPDRTGGGQVMAQTGSLLFTGPVTASTVRKIACDADIIPILLGGNGRVLDIGRASRVFPPHIRKALTARDGGCAFPGCTIPAPWCEAHHITYWSRGGTTGTENGVLLCSSHHHVIHKENWTIQLRTGIPWFIPPPHLDPAQKPRRNTYFQLE